MRSLPTVDVKTSCSRKHSRRNNFYDKFHDDIIVHSVPLISFDKIPSYQVHTAFPFPVHFLCTYAHRRGCMRCTESPWTVDTRPAINCNLESGNVIDQLIVVFPINYGDFYQENERLEAIGWTCARIKKTMNQGSVNLCQMSLSQGSRWYRSQATYQ